VWRYAVAFAIGRTDDLDTGLNVDVTDRFPVPESRTCVDGRAESLRFAPCG